MFQENCCDGFTGNHFEGKKRRQRSAVWRNLPVFGRSIKKLLCDHPRSDRSTTELFPVHEASFVN